MELQDIYVCHSFVKCLKGYLVKPAKHDYDALMSDNHRTLRVKNGGHLSELNVELCHN